MQVWDANKYQEHAAYVPELGTPVLDLLAPIAGERILDLGCGDGTLTMRLMQSGVSVVGVDSSPEMVAAARAHGIDARLADGVALHFETEFDAVFSNAALHWMRDADAVIGGVRRALKPNGRFVGEFGGHGNVAAIVVALLAALDRRGVAIEGGLPWYFPTADEYRKRLEDHGFSVSMIALIPRPTPLPTDVGNWLDTFANGILIKLPNGERRDARDEIVNLLRYSLSDERGNWTVDYVRLRFAAHL